MAYNLKKFATEADYNSATLNYPAVSWVESGDTLHYDLTQPLAPKVVATYLGGRTSSAECDSSSAITEGDINLINLVTVEIGDCVTSIGTYAFAYCSSLTSCTIGTSVTSIDEYAFYGCFYITDIIIPDRVTSIGEMAFADCSRLTSITVNATTPPTLANANAFSNTNDCPIYVPAASVSAYQSAWSSYASRIQAIP